MKNTLNSKKKKDTFLKKLVRAESLGMHSKVEVNVKLRKCDAF